MITKKFAVLAIVAASCTTLAFATETEGPKTEEKTNCKTNCCPCPQLAAQVSTMNADQQAFCNKLNAKCQQQFKAMSNADRELVMNVAKTKDANIAVEEAGVLAQKK